ncbi:hypothetical protein T05_1072, partial [Trichinella murrelli]
LGSQELCLLFYCFVWSSICFVSSSICFVSSSICFVSSAFSLFLFFSCHIC